MKTTYPINDFKSAEDWRIYHVYNDPEFQKMMKDAESELDVQKKDIKYEQIKTLFKIGTKDLNIFKMNQYIYIENKAKSTKLNMSEDFSKFSIEFTRETTRAEVIEEFKAFEQIIKELLKDNNKSRRRPPKNPELIYAIFKERNKGSSFTEIFNKYEKGKLIGYKGSNDQFLVAKELNDFYNRYKPS